MTQGAEPSRRVRLGSWGLLAGALVVSGLAVWWPITRRADLWELFRELEVAPPAITRAVLSVSYLLVVPVLALVGAAKEIWLADRWLTLSINTVHLLLVIAWHVAWWLGICWPLVTHRLP